MPPRHVLVIGGGIAGLSAARSLSHAGAKVTVLEREALPFSHSSGRNAAIFRPVETSAAVTELAARSFSLLRQFGADTPLLNPCGLTLAASSTRALAKLQAQAKEYGVAHRWCERHALLELHPELRSGRATCGLHLSLGGVLDPHGVAEYLRKSSLDRGATLRLSAAVREIRRNAAGVVGVELEDGTAVPASDVLVAAGAWSKDLLETCDSQLAIRPFRRHLALLATPAESPLPTAVAWDVESEVYLRAESGGILACPGDHTPSAPGLPKVDPAQVESLAQRLPELAPMYRNSQVKSVWACLRTMSPDRDLVAGRISTNDGLWVFSALAGHGMSAGLAAGELIANAILGRSSALLQRLSPARFGEPHKGAPAILGQEANARDQDHSRPKSS